MKPEAWKTLTQKLVGVAMGRIPADLVIRRGRWVCVQSGEILPDTSVAICGERIAWVGSDPAHTIGPATQVVEAEGRYLVPGFLDGHMHVESGMLTITEFVRAVLPHGTTGMFIDPHEIANVLGLRGVRLMVDEAASQPIHVWVQAPSCVPSAPGFESAGGELGPKEVREAMTWPGIIGLGEVMNFPGVSLGDDRMHAEMAEARAAGKVIGGHYASPDLGLPFHGYAAGGPEDDHEGTRLEDALARVRQGMKAMLRFGSGWHDVAAQVRAITELKLDPRHFLLVTDDSHSATLLYEGHVDRAVRHAIQQGLPPLTAIQMATLNTAEHFGVARDVGQIAPGRFADILLVTDLPSLAIDQVIACGKVAAERGELRVSLPEFAYPPEVRTSVRVKEELEAEDFRVRTPRDGTYTVNVIGIIENHAPTRRLKLTMHAVGGELPVSLDEDLAKVAIVERHKASGAIQVGFVHGFGFRAACAVASTVAHDCHNLLIVGTDDACMARAANELIRVGGGQSVVKDGEVVALLELPIAGLMSDQKADLVASKAERILEGFRLCGCGLNNPNMQMSLLALVVIPELRISDKGLVDVTQFKFVPLVEGEI